MQELEEFELCCQILSLVPYTFDPCTCRSSWHYQTYQGSCMMILNPLMSWWFSAGRSLSFVMTGCIFYPSVRQWIFEDS
jgi:hypothetical protein